MSGGWPKNSPTAFWICGIRVAPPTITTPWMSAGVSPASRNARFTGPSVFATRCAVIAVNVSTSSASSTLAPSDSVASIGADGCSVRFSFASRAFTISARVSSGDSGGKPAASRIQQ